MTTREMLDGIERRETGSGREVRAVEFEPALPDCDRTRESESARVVPIIGALPSTGGLRGCDDDGCRMIVGQPNGRTRGGVLSARGLVEHDDPINERVFGCSLESIGPSSDVFGRGHSVSSPISRLTAWWVSPPMEMRSTPVCAIAVMVCSLIPPDASSWSCGFERSRSATA